MMQPIFDLLRSEIRIFPQTTKDLRKKLWEEVGRDLADVNEVLRQFYLFINGVMGTEILDVLVYFFFIPSVELSGSHFFGVKIFTEFREVSKIKGKSTGLYVSNEIVV
jgi:hypothetical protein